MASEELDTEDSGPAWMIALVAICLAVIAGCPPVRRVRIRQDVHGWQCEQIDNLHVTVTNNVIFLEIGPAKKKKKK